MRRFLTSFFAFALYGFVVYAVLMICFGNWAPKEVNKNLNYKLGSYGFSYSRFNEANQTKNVDILFLGSSHAYRGYDTRIFKQMGFSVFNLGSNAQSPVVTEALVEKYLNQLNPKFIIFDVYPRVFGSDGIEPALDVVANKDNGWDTFDLTLKMNNIKVYNTYLYSFLRQQLGMNNGFVESPVKDADKYVNGGYVETFRKFNARQKPASYTYTIREDQLEAFKHVIAIIKDKKIPYVLVQAPISKDLYSVITNNDEMDKLSAQYGKYYNFNKVLSLSNDYFFDDNHLNQNGVNIFNKNLIEQLRLQKTANGQVSIKL